MVAFNGISKRDSERLDEPPSISRVIQRCRDIVSFSPINHFKGTFAYYSKREPCSNLGISTIPLSMLIPRARRCYWAELQVASP
jgi:hypothetical protein